MKRLVVASAILAACLGPPKRTPYRFYIPEDYVGWVQVEFQVQGAAPLATEEGYRLVRFPSSGLSRTSSAMEDGWAKDEYYAYSGSGRVKLSDAYETGVINAGATGVDGTVHFWRFFVGPQAEYLKHGYPNTVRPSIGPVARAR